MLGDPDNESVFDRLSEMFWDKLGFLAPVWIARREETLIIEDYRPTLYMFFTGAGFLLFAVIFVVLLIKIPGGVASIGLWAVGAIAVICFVLSFRGTIREAYYFNKSNDSYVFVRRFIHRKEIIEGSLSQFTGAYVKTTETDDSEVNHVILKQEGLFMTGVAEQTLREEVPIFNTWNNEARIADAITGFLPVRRSEN